jgi:tetratricopeptide (TPR) repeat protein
MIDARARTLTIFCLVAFAPSVGIGQGAADERHPSIDSLRVAIDEAVSRGDLEMLRNARSSVERTLHLRADDGLLLHYQGYALYREAELLRQLRKGDEADRALDESQAILERSAKLRPLPETHALLALIIGQRMARNPLSAVLQSRRWSGEMDHALRIGPDNPRVLLLRGINAAHAPRAFGGGVARAQEYLEQSIALFGRARSTGLLPAWGHAEAYAWLGRLLERRGDRERAERAYVRALELDPDFAWVSRVLLPRLRSRRGPPSQG